MKLSEINDNDVGKIFKVTFNNTGTSGGKHIYVKLIIYHPKLDGTIILTFEPNTQIIDDSPDKLEPRKMVLTTNPDGSYYNENDYEIEEVNLQRGGKKRRKSKINSRRKSRRNSRRKFKKMM
jgi:hypothetical protein